MYQKLSEINRRPALFERYTAESLWADEYRSKRMLAFHLNEAIDVSSRNIQSIDAAVSWIVGKFDLGPGKSLCDFGCGPGLYTSRFAASGAEVTGLDFSANSIRYAREQADRAKQKINYIHTNYLEFEPTDQFDLITMIMCDFCALSPSQRKHLLNLFDQCLKTDGAILLDVYSMAAFSEQEEASYHEKNQLDHFWCEEDYFCFVNRFKYDSDAVFLDKYDIFPENGGAETVYNWLQYFSPDSLSGELEAAGFAIKDIYADVAGNAFSKQHSEFTVVATKTRARPDVSC